MKILKFKQSAIMQIQVHLNDAEYQNEWIYSKYNPIPAYKDNNLD